MTEALELPIGATKWRLRAKAFASPTDDMYDLFPLDDVDLSGQVDS